MDAIVEEILREEACFSLKDLAVNGTDMLDLGFRGREIGAVLQKCLDAVLDERAANDREELLSFARTERGAVKYWSQKWSGTANAVPLRVCRKLRYRGI